jgi:hypothetical protein
MNGRKSFLWGCVRALAPEVVRFFKLVASGSPLPHLDWLLYAGFLFLFMLVAGPFSVAFRPDTEWKGLWVGASLPALIATLVQTAPNGPK